MKKYITKGDLFKKGLIIRKYEDSDNYHIDGYFSAIELTEHDIEFCIDNDIIKELKEPEFTKDDMIVLIRYDLNCPKWKPEDVFNEWLKQRK